MWDTVFGTANVLAMVMWAGLILLPRWPALLAGVLYAGVGLLCLAYSVGLIGILTGTFGAVGGEVPAVGEDPEARGLGRLSEGDLLEVPTGRSVLDVLQFCAGCADGHLAGWLARVAAAERAWWPP